MHPIPTTFNAQLWARLFQNKAPKFFQLLQKYSLYFTLASIAIPFVLTDVLPGIGVDVPTWLTYVNAKLVLVFGVLSGIGIGGVIVSSTPIDGPTPELTTPGEKQQTESEAVLNLLQDVRNELAELRAKVDERPTP